MHLPFGLLGLLNYRDRTGYDLAKIFEASINKFWHAQTSQIYRELNRMEEKGWVASKSIVQEGKPNKRLYSITDDGKEAFDKWLKEPALLFENRHSPLLIFIFFGASAPHETLRRLKGVRDAFAAAIPEQQKINQASIDNYKKGIENGEQESLYWQMTLDFGLAEAKMIMQWADECIKKLEKLEDDVL